MRLIKSLSAVIIVTLVALVYVHQQVELVKLSYSINYKEKKLKDILDRKDSLGYNIANLEDPKRLESVLLAKRIDISFPKRGNVFKVARATPDIRSKIGHGLIGFERKGNFSGLLEFFGLRAEAQAREK